MARTKKSATGKDLTIKKVVNTTPTTLKGMKDFLPYDNKYWDFVNETYKSIVKSYSFDSIETPVIENPVLFLSLLGKDVDETDEGICVFGGKGRQKIVLRPNIRTSVARATIVHNLIEDKDPIKLSYSGQTFSCEKDRALLQYRRSYSMGFEVMGDESPAIDAHLILVGHTLLKKLGLESTVLINSIGDLECRELYKQAIADYFKQYKTKLDTEQKKWLRKDPIRLLSLKGKKYRDMVEAAPQIVDYLSDDCKAHFFAVLEYLDEFDIPYSLDPSLMRDFNYYNRTVFSFFEVNNGEPVETPYGGGGRYDYVIQKLSGQEVAACGVDFDVEQLVNNMKSKNVELPAQEIPQIFIAQIGEAARKKAMVLFEELQAEGYTVKEGFIYSSLKKQLEIANKINIPHILILGHKEVSDGTILYRDTAGGIQETFDFSKIKKELKKLVK